MKKLIIVLCVLLTASLCYAQDTIVYELKTDQTIKAGIDDVEVEWIERTTIQTPVSTEVNEQTMTTCMRKIKAHIQGCQDVIAAKQAEIIQLEKQLSDVADVVAEYPILGVK